MRARPVMERLMEKVVRIPFSGCWVWMGTTARGYGMIGDGTLPSGNARMVYTHRLMFNAYKGEIPAGKEVCHSCDVASCCNPDHLFAGTHQENVQDMISKKRGDAYRRGSSATCNRGHILTGIHCDGRRYCKTCKIDRQRIKRAAYK